MPRADSPDSSRIIRIYRRTRAARGVKVAADPPPLSRRLTIWHNASPRMFHVIPRIRRGRPTIRFRAEQGGDARRNSGEWSSNATVGALLDDDGKLAVLPTAARAVQEVPASEWATYAPIAGTPGVLPRGHRRRVGHRAETLRGAAIAAATPGRLRGASSRHREFLEPGQSMLRPATSGGRTRPLADEADRKVATFRMFTPEGGARRRRRSTRNRAQLASQERVLLFLNDPCNNPTGYSMRREEWRAVVARCSRAPRRGPSRCSWTWRTRLWLGDPRAFLQELEPLLGKAAVLFAWSASKRSPTTASVSARSWRASPTKKSACRPSRRSSIRPRHVVELQRAAASRRSRGSSRTRPRARVRRRARDLKSAPGARRRRSTRRASEEARLPALRGGFLRDRVPRRPEAKAGAMKDAGRLRRSAKAPPNGHGRGALRVALCSVAEKDVVRLVEALA